eukprot:CAMPEP_0168311492 /NCGR_PEP_ID=MMETSP0142_2-20121227/67395_1 /TAXON_ID=44445 /ORGANISM="Pseudo-nitzschia australis, Strain 10249 10 AB" /LENGTH=457 /DNA_ID=CAMNT_0008264399 /DNA_START=671 /DNA_END=2046 /DNA_ORIENTATION=-
MYYAINQFETQLSREQAGKIEQKWLELPAETRLWVAFKMFWIKAILRRKYLTTERHDANHAALERTNNDLTSAMETVASVRQENQLLAQRQLALSAESTTSMRPLSALPPPVQATIPDEISALTDMLGRFAALSTATMITSPSTTSTARSLRPRQRNCNRNRNCNPPPSGSGLFYGSYCWKCGCNMDTHNANHAAIERNSNDLASAMETVATVRHENQLLAQRKLALSAQINHINEASACPALPVQATIPDDISALTNMLGQLAALSMATTSMSPSTSSTAGHRVLGIATAIAILPPVGADRFMVAIAGSVAAIAHTGPVNVTTLPRPRNINKAPACAAPPVQAAIPDDISALTDLLGRFSALSIATTDTSPATSSTAQSSQPQNRHRNGTRNPPSNGNGPFLAAIAGSVAAIAHTGPVNVTTLPRPRKPSTAMLILTTVWMAVPSSWIGMDATGTS